ncbi:amino acid adenylation domain-containing protein [Micromonospora sp. NPDC049257]|uniref:amino acid adenylation domain-containing protein n=1 Tax=Micromonospora sp. NPDC049257 TaxID=3155771 RepID=UPI0034138EAB
MTVRHTPALAATTLTEALEATYRDNELTPAVVTPTGTWTYRDLAARAHGVAAAVRTATPAAGQSPIVAVVLDRSPDLVATVMGVAAAGAVYLPLDPGTPDTYLGQIFDESRPSMVVTSSERAQRLRGLTRAPVVTPLDLTSSAAGDAAGITGHPPEKQVSTAEVAPRDPAYVIYTSGSTGRPKGVVVSGEALLNATAARVDRYGPAGRVPLLHSPAFDLTTGVLFWTILSGGTLVIAPGGLADVAATVALIHRHDITHLIYPASLYGAFLDRAAHRPPASLVAVGIGSERWSPVLIERHARVLPAVSLVNEYGPTEATVCSSYALLYDGPHARSAPMSIGRPVRNTGYLLLDSDRNLATGAGELAITGTNLALGYLNNPGLTAQRFVTLASGERAYLTGDLAERDPAGDFVFLGRADRQIQVGGHRVEPGHIETVLMGHPGVMQAHVTGRPGGDGTGSSTLVAYLVPHPDPNRSTPTASSPVPARGGEGQMAGDCDQYLRDRVPAYLVPSAYVVLPELPRTPAGKIDEAELPNPTVATAAAAPTDPLHQALVRAAADILGVATVPVDQPLTSLGASSLVLIRLAAVIAHDHGVDVPISALFGASAIHQIAELVRAGTPSGRPVLRPAAGEPETVYGSVWPLSGQQRQIWVLTQMAPDALAYSTQFSLRMSGPVDVDALQAALSHVVARHEILRTTFHDGPDGPVQVVREPWAARVDLVDLSDLDDDAQAAELDCRMRAAVAAGFDVAVLPLVRWHLFRLGPRSWRLLQVEHHFAHDGWSAQLFLAETRDAYRAILDGEVPHLDALPVQYRDYATWYQQWRSTGDYADQVTYWRNRMHGCPPEGTTFAPDRPRPAGRTYRGGRLVAHIPPETVRRLDALAVAHGVSRFAVFLAAFALQVWQHTHERDMVIGSALVNRRQAGTESLLGMFVNALPLRLDVDPDASTAALLQATMTTLLGAQDHQELPLLDLLAHLNVPRDPGNPLFNLMFAFHDTPRPDFQVGTLSGQLVIEHNGTAKADLNVVCVPDPPTPGEAEHRPGMSILWEFDSDLFDPDTARELLSGYERILHVLPQTPDRPVRDLDLLGTSETTRILAAGTGPHDAMPSGTLHAGFDSAAAAHPHAVALEHAGTRWTYRDLDLRAGALQHRLTALGVRPGHIVAVACPPGVELITTILATLRLGAAYVCLDPGQPSARTRLMLADADVRAIVTTHQTTNGHDTGWPPAGTALLYADDPAPGPEPAGPPPAAPGVRPGDRAYLVYTSGSTGTPKAVVTTHRNACAALHARTRHHAVTSAPATPVRTLVTLPAIFDVAPHMMLWTLQTGGTIVLPDTAEQAQDPDQIRALVDRHQVTHVNFTASFYRALLGTMPTEWQPTLRVVAIGGEACAPDDVRDHARRLPHVALDNEYGPTEATVWCSVARLHPPEPDARSRVTVGLPLTNNSMFVLGPDGDLLPAGAAGELFIGGAGVAAGYHRQPDLTRARFVTPQRGPLAGQRLYRTGDRARLRAGRYEILGRLDDQVKIRGYRIELGEITACLLQHPDVTDAAVTVQGRSDAGKLIAFVATAYPQACLPNLLRAWTAQRLPAYMAPAGYVVVDELPRTATGKLQPERLSTLSTPVAAAEPIAVPTTQRQQRLLRTWREQLQRPDLGIDDDFFACGGDSLQAIQAAARARDLGIEVTVAQLVAAPTIRALDRLLTTPDDEPTVALAATTRRPGGTPLALTAIQAWFFAQDFADPDHFHQARLFTLADTCDLPSLRAAARWALHRHDAFRTRFTRHDHAWTAVLDDATPGDLIREHTLPPAGNQPTSERLTPVLEGLHDDLSIASGRLASVTIVRDNDGRQRWLYIIAHHLIIDAVSWQILVDDVERAYRLLHAGQALPEGSTPGLPTAPTTPPKVGPEPDPHWQNLATAAKPVLTGTGSGGPPAPVGARIRVRRRLSTHAGRYLRHDAHRLRGVGAQAILLAALRRALQPFTDSPDLYVWLEGHGRSHHGSADHEGVVGWLTTLYPALLTATDTHPGRLIDVAADFQRQLAAIPDGGSGFGQARYLHPDSPLGRQLEAIAAPQATVNYLGHPQSTGRNRILRPVPGPTGASIAASNVLPTPIDLTVAADPDGIMSCRFLIDTGLLTPQAAEDMADRFTDEVEAAARLIALTPMPVQADARTLFLIHPVGGKIDWYTDLAAALGPGWDCYGLPHDGSTDADTLPALAQTYLDRLRAAKPDGPYTLAGWCLGAVLAYEMTQQAQRDGDSHRIDDLFLLDPPHAEQPLDADDAIITHVQYALMQHGWPDQPRQAITAALDATKTLPIPDRAHALAAVLAPESIVPPSWPSQHESLLHQMRIRLVCHAAMSAWHPAGQTPTLQLILPHTVTPGTENATRTWQTRSSDPHVTTVAGDHESMLTGPGLDHITTLLHERHSARPTHHGAARRHHDRTGVFGYNALA